MWCQWTFEKGTSYIIIHGWISQITSNSKDQKIAEMEAKCDQLEKAIDTIETNTKLLPEGKKSTEKSRSGITCYKCNEDGHMARRCPSAGMGRRGLGGSRGVPRGKGSFENYVDMTR